MDDFDKFWITYPKKRKKADARKAWIQKKSVRPPVEHIISVVQAYCRTPDWIKNDGEFIPYPATFIRAEQWDDELEVKMPEVVNGKLWNETASGIEAKGKEFGLFVDKFNSWQHFRASVERAAEQADEKPKLRSVA